ncbi:MAG: DUF3050 domain-containing protein [Bacteriovoracaceae bacterium]
MKNQIQVLQKNLSSHPVYTSFNQIENIRHFMEYHVFAVWDFMSLLKSLQRSLTCVELPWRPSGYPAEMVRLINQIVVGEESDLDQYGKPCSHFYLYLRAMEEVGADTTKIKMFMETLDFDLIPQGAREFVRFNLETATNGSVLEVASSFFYGREKLIPDMFEAIVQTLEKENVKAPTLIYYLKRHIEVDGGEHGPLAERCLDVLAETEEKKEMAYKMGVKALQMRGMLWDSVLESMNAKVYSLN